MHEGKRLKEKLTKGEVCLGTWINFSDPTVAELLTESGFDFFIIDTEHSAQDNETVQLNCMATKGTPVTPMVRVAWNDQVLIKRALDVGAGGILIPMVRSAGDVENGVAACMYPPTGIRGFGPRRPAGYERHFAEYIKTANENIIVWAQIEHIDAVNDIDQIVRVPNLSGILIGAFDLSGSMGILGQTGHPDVQAAIMKVIQSAKAAGLPAGIAGPGDVDLACKWIEKGVQFITLGGDQGYLVKASHALVGGVRERIGR